MQSFDKELNQSSRGLAEPPTGSSGVDWFHAAGVIARLSNAGSLDDVVYILRRFCRDTIGAAGIVVVLREGDECLCIAQDADDGVWQGRRFAQHACVSGWAMLNRQPVGIADIYQDDRVPHEIYRETFVRSMAMVPIGEDEPLAAVGAYWGRTGHPNLEEMAILQAIARSASTALTRARLLSDIIDLNRSLEVQLSECGRQLEDAQRFILQTQKMDVVGQLAGTVAHDINNLLSPIMASLDHILHSGSPSAPTQGYAQLAMETVEKARALVHRLLAFIRGQPLHPAVIDLQSLLKGMEPLLALSIGDNIQLRIAAPPGIPNILGERQQLEIAVLNLAINARDAMPQGGKLVIGLSVSGSSQAVHSGNGAFVRLYVKDEGTGMDETTRKRILEPHFTTKKQGLGTGLGLSMVHDMVQKAGGVIDIRSELGAGTEISLWLPATNAAATLAPTVDREGGTKRKGMVIVVDDHDLVRKAIASTLSDEGYEVAEAESAEACLDRLRAGLRPDVIIADQLMPGMSGIDLAHEVYRFYPKTAFVLISGQDCPSPAPFDIVRMTKPFRLHELQTSIDHARRQSGSSEAWQ